MPRFEVWQDNYCMIEIKSINSIYEEYVNAIKTSFRYINTVI